MTAFRVQAKRTTNSGPPPDLEFGELAYSDADRQFYIGRPAPAPPATFKGDLTDYSAAIADLTNDLATLDSSQTAQDNAIALLTTASDGQANALSTLATDTQAALGTKLEAAAIADFETTAQLNDRDTANRARANHTGPQPASTITGLATVATSGAYADLSGRPAVPFGFTYDQQAEPVGPAAGATWRERSAGGLIVGEWEWSGSLWLGELRFSPLYSGQSASATTAQAQSVYPRFPVLLTGYTANFTQPFGPQDASNHWVFRAFGVEPSDFLTTINQSLIDSTCLQKTLATPVVIDGTSNSLNNVQRVGTPGNLRQFQVITHYRLVRS